MKLRVELKSLPSGENYYLIFKQSFYMKFEKKTIKKVNNFKIIIPSIYHR